MSVKFLQKPWFPEVENELDTLQFLDASRGIVWLVEQFGYIFEPVKNDLLGNIEKINKKYLENTEEFNCLLRLILYENKKGEDFATESLLWLRRGLSFMGKFLSVFIENEKRGKRDEDLCRVMAIAYEETLEPHHGWVTRLVFRGLKTCCPSRSQLLTIMRSENCNEDELMIALSDYSRKLSSTLEALIIFCKEHNIEPYH